MADYSSYHEATLLSAESNRWKELTINTGATQGVLQDVNLPDSAGGFSYRDSGRVSAITRNRFIYWRSSQDTVELVELSLDYNLSGNAVRLRFPDAPILPRVSIHETHSHVVILVATIHSVHRLIVPHPNKLHRMEPYGGGSNSSTPSVFADVSLAQFRESTNYHVISQSGTQSYEFHASAAWLTNEGEALFAMATNIGSVVLIKLAPMGIQGIVTQHELRQATVMQRLWTGLVPAVMRRGQETIDTTLSLVMHPMGQDFFIFCVCRDHRLRMWSAKNQNCLASRELLEFLPDGSELSEAPAVGHKIRMAVGSDSRNPIIGIYLGFPDRNQFLVLQPALEDGQWRLLHIASFEADKDSTLIDFGLTLSHLWAVWSTPTGETVAKFKPYEGGGPSGETWSPIFLTNSHSADLLVPPFLEPREAYMDHIFQPGKFSLHSVARALNLYHSQSGGSNIGSLSDLSQVSVEVLKQETMAVISNDIQQKAGGSEMTQEDYHELLRQSWSKFYACCVQYQEVANKAVGIMLDQSTGMVAIIKKSLFSVLRPCDAIEHLYLSPIGSCIPEDLANVPFVTDESSLCLDLIALSDCVKLVRAKLSPIIKLSFENDLLQLVRPEEVAHQIASDLLGLGVDNADTPGTDGKPMVFTTKLSQRLQAIQDMDTAMQSMLAALDLAEGNPEALMLEEEEADAQQHLIASRLFTSTSAIDLLASSHAQISHTRLNLLRDLLILQCAMLRLGQQASIAQDVSIKIQSELIPETANLLLAYHVLYWLSGCKASLVPTNSIESNLRQLAALEITSSASRTTSDKKEGASLTVIQLFLQGVGGAQVRAKISKAGYLSQDACEIWTSILLPAVNKLAQLILYYISWPISADFLFSEFLMGRCQFTQLQECIRLLNPWCEWNSGSRHFLLGHCFLNSGDPHKALSCFLRVCNRLPREDFLLNKLLQTEELEGKKLDILYYLKVIRLLEQFSVPDLVISLANTALSVADDDDPNIPTLWSKVFKYHLELGHIDQAYRAMTSNVDHERRHDCLRQFVVVLCERAQIKQLCQYPYIDLHDEVVSIIESRARSVDLTTHNYYDLLYAFHIYRGNYRKAGGVMYEHAMRLALEVPTLDGLQRQAKCYLAAMNALRLVHANYAWIVKPALTDTQHKHEDMLGASPKRTFDGEELMEQHMKRQVTVLELKDIEKEYLLVSARLKLANHEQDSSYVTGIYLSANETLSLLVQAGLFDTSVTVCNTFKLPLISVFQGLATKCVKLSTNGPDDMTWKWLSANDLGQLNPSRDISPADLAWRLLRAYLNKYDKEGDHSYYKCVVNKLLSLGFHLPKWLVNTYKKLHAAELLLLYINFDMLEEATYLALEYIDAVMGNGKEYFGLTTPLRATDPSVWLPYNAIEHLLRALKDTKGEPLLQKLHLSLDNKLKLYHNKAQDVSQQMTNLALQRYQQGTA